MRYMLDTDTCSYIIRQRMPEILATLQQRAESGAEISISAITCAELRLGAERSRSAAKYHKAIQMFCERLNRVAPWDAGAADEFARVQGKLLKSGRPIGNNDAMIAGHARHLGCTLVTNNQKHFSKVPGLQLDNWVTPH